MDAKIQRMLSRMTVVKPPIGLLDLTVKGTRIQVQGGGNIAAIGGTVKKGTPERHARSRADAYPDFNAIRDGRSDHGTVAIRFGRCDTVILELSLVGFLNPLARKFDTYP